MFAVKAIDAANNVSPADTVTWTIEAPDTTPPVSTVGSGPGSSTTATTATFTFTANETGSTFNCSLDTAPFAPCTSPVTVNGLALGNHTFRVRARDAAGNFENPGATYAWAVVAPPPDCGVEMTLTASGDAWVDQGSRGTNKGADSTLKVTTEVLEPEHPHVRAASPFHRRRRRAASCSRRRLRMFSSSAVNGRTLQALRVTGDVERGCG